MLSFFDSKHNIVHKVDAMYLTSEEIYQVLLSKGFRDLKRSPNPISKIMGERIEEKEGITYPQSPDPVQEGVIKIKSSTIEL